MGALVAGDPCRHSWCGSWLGCCWTHSAHGRMPDRGTAWLGRAHAKRPACESVADRRVFGAAGAGRTPPKDSGVVAQDAPRPRSPGVRGHRRVALAKAALHTVDAQHQALGALPAPSTTTESSTRWDAWSKNGVRISSPVRSQHRHAAVVPQCRRRLPARSHRGSLLGDRLQRPGQPRADARALTQSLAVSDPSLAMSPRARRRSTLVMRPCQLPASQ